MILTSVKLSNFRIHKRTELEFSEKLNYLVGGNGQGKTSILESIYYLCTTKSFETKTDGEVVTFGEYSFEINGEFKDITENNVRVNYLSNENKKLYFLNDKQLTRSSEVIGMFPVVLLTPADHSITQGTPGERRKFVDSVISQASNTYLQGLLDYNKTLRQRSSLLSRMREGADRQMLNELDSWSEKLVQAGTEIIKQRINFINDFNPFIMESYSKIMGKTEVPGISYKFLNNFDGDNIKERFELLLSEKRNDELRRATNLVGPHKDDFILSINDLNLKTYGSQGQHKTFQAVLRFAEFFYLKNVTGKTPIFLLDDVFGELDANRAGSISLYLKEVGQAFVTLTDFGNFKFLTKESDDKVIKLQNGTFAYA